MMGFGERLKDERKRLKLSAERFGALLGIAGNTQYNYEKEERSPDVAYLEGAARIGCDVIYLLTGDRASAVSEGDAVSPEQRALLNAFDQLEQPVRTFLLRAVLDANPVQAAPANRMTDEQRELLEASKAKLGNKLLKPAKPKTYVTTTVPGSGGLIIQCADDEAAKKTG